MRHAVALPLLVAALVAASASAPGRAAAADAGATPSAVPACITVAHEARYVPYGYNHVVIVTNACTKSAVCTIATDVAPSPITSEVPARTSVEVTTFLGSPARTFVPRVRCVLSG